MMTYKGKLHQPTRRSILTAGTAFMTSALLANAEGPAARPPADARQARPDPSEIQVHCKSIDLGGINIFYREAGPANARVILLLHGYPTSSRMYRNLIPLLATKYRVIAPDYPGFGHSDVPSRATFSYTHENLSDVMDALLTKLSIRRFSMYVMDFGGPIGYRLMLKYPGRFISVVAQNTPVFGEAGHNPAWADLVAYWKDKSPENRERIRPSIQPDAIRRQYTEGVRDPTLLDPDSWTIDSALIQRPGVDEIMLDLLYDIKNNRATVNAAKEYFGTHQDRLLVATGVNDRLFPGEIMTPPKTMPEVAFRGFDSGHFALEDKGEEIGRVAMAFYNKTITA